MEIKKKRALGGGPYITRLAKNLEIFIRLSGLNLNPKMAPLNIEVMQNIGMVRLQRDRYVLIRQAKKEEPPTQQADVPMDEAEQ